MKRPEKIVPYLFAAMIACAAFLFVLVVLVNLLINQKAVIQKIETLASEKLGGRVELDHLSLSLLPIPGILVHDARFNTDAVAALTISNLTVYPGILPLFIGKLQIQRIKIEKPDVTLTLPDLFSKEKKEAEPVTVQGLQEKIVYVVHAMMSDVLDGVVDIEDGTLSLTGKNGHAVRFYTIDARFDNSGLRGEITFQCQSNLAGQVRIDGHMQTNKSEYHLNVSLLDLKPGMLTAFFPPRAGLMVTASQMDVDINLTIDRAYSMQGDVACAYDSLDLQLDKEKLVIKGRRLEGVFTLDGKGMAASLGEIKLDYPQLVASGVLSVNFDSQGYFDQEVQGIDLELTGRDIDIQSVREVLHKVVGKNPVVRDVLNRVRAGEVSAVRFHSQGRSWADIWAPENFIITGDVLNGRLYTPEIELTVDAIQGKVTITNGIIEGENIAGKIGNTTGRNGSLTLNPAGKGIPFQLDIAVDVDLAELPAVLAPILQGSDIKNGLELIQNLSGKASGRLMLGDTIEAIQPAIEIEELDLSFDDTHLHAEGDIRFLSNTKDLQVNMAVDTMDLEKVEAIFKKMRQGGPDKQAEALSVLPRVTGTVNLEMNEARYADYSACPVHMVINFKGDDIRVHLNEADICGIKVTGTLRKSPQGVTLNVEPFFEDEDLNAVLGCLIGKRIEMDGYFDAAGLFTAQGTADTLINSLKGVADFEARNGRIYTMRPLSKMLVLLNTTNVFGERLPDLKQSGFRYNTVFLKTTSLGGKATISEMVVDGTTMHLIGMGDIDFGKSEIDMTVLVVPLKRVDRVIKKIPVVGYILGGTLMTVPIHIRGDLSDPDVSFRPLSAVGSDLLGIAKRTLSLPVKVIDPIFRSR